MGIASDDRVILLVFALSFLLRQGIVHSRCPPVFTCPNLPAQLLFPLTDSRSSDCGLLMINCTIPTPMIRFAEHGPWYNVLSINQFPYQSITFTDQKLEYNLQNNQCQAFNNFSVPSSPLVLFTLNNLSMFKCEYPVSLAIREYFQGYESYSKCGGFLIYYNLSNFDGLVRGIPPTQCSVIQMPRTWAAEKLKSNNLFDIVTATVTFGYNVSSDCLKCHSKGGQCNTNPHSGQFHCVNGRARKFFLEAIGIAASVSVIGTIIVLLYVKRKFVSVPLLFCRGSHKETSRHVESFLRSYGSPIPRRYSYSEIKKMTNSFKSKLGQGGCGSVYKGKVLDGRLVAVKVISKSRGDVQEFMNEVASIGRTSHVNIVTLLGYCFEGQKRALIYEFMAKGSLEKYIFAEEDLEHPKLGWETLYKIALGIARGLEYLHRGCNTCILHFDIKPHNILLDEDFHPKISDFGLAKLCPKKESIISMSDPRGTVGYIAPEVVCRTIGRVSHKSDVYSYGMMVLEIVGGRKNVNAGADRTSEIYFPNWIYKRVQLCEDPGLCGISNEEDREKAMKMVLVSLWCIQTDPSNRPTMSQVVDMLQGSLESLQMPPRPYLSSPTRSTPESPTAYQLTM